MRSIWRRKFWVEFNLHPKQIFFAEGEKTLLTIFKLKLDFNLKSQDNWQPLSLSM
jgi:hypothetical protein